MYAMPKDDTSYPILYVYIWSLINQSLKTKLLTLTCIGRGPLRPPPLAVVFYPYSKL